MGNEIDLKQVISFMDLVERRAGEVVLSYFEKDFRIERKNAAQGRIDIVTQVDRESEQIILDAIRKEYPDHDVVSEERPPELTGSRWRWFVDPLDGTVNFAHGYPIFSISIALTDHDTLLAAMIYDPLRDECFSATRDRGAFLNSRPIRVSGTTRLDESVVATGFPYDRASSPENNVAEFSRVVTRVQGIRRGGSAAIDLAYVSCGRLDGFWELKLKPWDQAAGMLLVEEAGGRVSDRTGGPTNAYALNVVATNGLIHDQLVNLVSPK